MTRLRVGPFNRVEGDLEVTLDVADGQVRDARVTSSLYRGFEQILQGKPPMDALVFVPRICGICSVSQSAAAAQALAVAMDIRPPDNGRLAANLIHAVENVADHVTHFYLFFMPDFARDCYESQPWWHAASNRFRAVTGTAAGDFLSARANWMRAMGLEARHIRSRHPSACACYVCCGTSAIFSNARPLAMLSKRCMSFPPPTNWPLGVSGMPTATSAYSCAHRER
jgi:hydrogenase large subunit